ncbi:MAG TPA: hypothetical protein VE177_04435, partial [Candidatus Binatus sp.]|nr:hypothetical protein [Candidatus Binatus sp.]
MEEARPALIGLLSIIIFLPVVMALPTFMLGRRNRGLAKILGVGATLATFLLSILSLFYYQYGILSIQKFQMVESFPWAPAF